MITKKRAKKSEAAGKKTAKKKGASAKKLQERDPEEVRENITKMVQNEAEKLAQAVMGVGMTGQLAPVKYLLEMAHLYPKADDGSEATKDEDCLAKTLLDRLNIPDTPVAGEDEDVVVIPAKKAEVKAERPEGAEVREEEEVPVG
jgi:hypothetical protein